MSNFKNEKLLEEINKFYNDISNPETIINYKEDKKDKNFDYEDILGDKNEQVKRGNNFYEKGGNKDYNSHKQKMNRIDKEKAMKKLVKRIAATVMGVAVGMGTYNMVQNHKETQKEKILAEKNFSMYMEDRTKNVSEYTENDLNKFKEFSLAVMSIDRYDGSDDESKTKKKNAETVIINYTRNGKLEKTADKLMDMKIRDAMYYGDFSKVNLNNLKDKETVETEVWQKINQFSDSKMIIKDLKGTSHSEKLIPINNDIEKNVTSEFQEFMDDLVDLKCKTKWSDKKCLKFAKNFYSKMAIVADKRYILDKNGNLKEISKEEFDERVVKRDLGIDFNNKNKDKDHDDR